MFIVAKCSISAKQNKFKFSSLPNHKESATYVHLKQYHRKQCCIQAQGPMGIKSGANQMDNEWPTSHAYILQHRKHGQESSLLATELLQKSIPQMVGEKQRSIMS